jgi:hypothetical protein
MRKQMEKGGWEDRRNVYKIEREVRKLTGIKEGKDCEEEERRVTDKKERNVIRDGKKARKRKEGKRNKHKQKNVDCTLLNRKYVHLG